MRTLFFTTFVALAILGQCGSAQSQQGDIVYPAQGTTWKVGESVNVTFQSTSPSVQTVSLFFANDRTTTLGGGPLSQLVFKFTVKESALSPPGGTSLLTAVRREDNHLMSVDTVNINVVR